ncbi:MAG: hypothetical protein ABL308_12625 [Oceanicaulis sp.]
MIRALIASPLALKIAGGAALAAVTAALTVIALQARTIDRLEARIGDPETGLVALLTAAELRADTLAAAVEIQNGAVLDLQARGRAATERAAAGIDAAGPVIDTGRAIAARVEPAGPAGSPQTEAARCAAYDAAAARIDAEARLLLAAMETRP